MDIVRFGMELYGTHMECMNIQVQSIMNEGVFCGSHVCDTHGHTQVF
jgi:hypothetical protein